MIETDTLLKIEANLIDKFDYIVKTPIVTC